MKSLLLAPLLLSALTEHYPDYRKQPKNHLYLLSEPRSGTHWLQASLQYLTERRTLPFEKERARTPQHLAKFGLNMLDVPLDTKKPPLFRTHCEKNMKRVIGDIAAFSRRNKLVFITRNYKEVFPRRVHIYTKSTDWPQLLQKYDYLLTDYVRKLAFFDTWNPKNRHIIYYEDLISDPKSVFTALTHFLQEGTSRLPTFLSSQKALREKSIAYYRSHVPTGTKSTGKETTFHSLALPPAILQELDKRIYEKNPPIVKKYLARYRPI